VNEGVRVRDADKEAVAEGDIVEERDWVSDGLRHALGSATSTRESESRSGSDWESELNSKSGWAYAARTVSNWASR